MLLLMGQFWCIRSAPCVQPNFLCSAEIVLFDMGYKGIWSCFSSATGH